MAKFHYTKSVPEKIYVACSGGADSVACADILASWRDVTLLHYHHGEAVGDHERNMVEKLANKLNVPLITAEYTGEPIVSNKESQWRENRYRWFHSFDVPVVVAHTLDDAVETYLMTCLRGQGQYMNYNKGNVIRPFLLTRKQALLSHLAEHGVQWFEDPSNADEGFALRNRIRHTLVPVVADIEPGVYNMVRRRIIERMGVIAAG